MSNKAKGYGLLLPDKTPSNAVKKIFNDDSDSEEEQNSKTDWLERSLKAKKQTRIDIARALKDDPTVYQYDEVYDDIQQKKTEVTELKKKADRKPRYISMLLQQAARRKVEHERRIEKQIQKEREVEGDEFADKESYITPSYKKKLEEMKLFEEEDLRRDMLEEIGDVTKQKDMTGFYRHLYRTVTSEEKCEEGTATKEAGNKSSKFGNSNDSNDENSDEGNNHSQKTFPKKFKSDTRRYRRNDKEQTPWEENSERVDNLQTDSKNSSDRLKKPRNLRTKDKASDEVTSVPQNNPNLDSDTSLSNSTSESEDEVSKSSKKSEPKTEVPENASNNSVNVENNPIKKEKRDIWAKRTVGKVLEEALERYLSRKADRIANKGQ